MKPIITICMLWLTVAVQGQSVTAIADVAKELLHIVELHPAEMDMSDSINRVLDGAIDAFVSGTVRADSEAEARISSLLRENEMEEYSDPQESRRMIQRRMNCQLALALFSDGEKRKRWMGCAERNKGEDKELSGAYVGVMLVRLLFLLKENGGNTEGLLREIEQSLRDNKEYIPDKLMNKCREIVEDTDNCNKNDSTMIQPYGEIEKYDFVSTKNGTEDAITERDGWVIEKRKFSNGRVWYDEYAPASGFYMIQKDFRSNGMIWRRTKYLGYVRFGMYEEFDEEGKLTKLIDEDKKFGKIKPQDIVELLEKEGWFNRKTGEQNIMFDDSEYYKRNVEAHWLNQALPLNGYFYKKLMNYIFISFFEAIIENGKEISPPLWKIRVHKTKIGISEVITYYTINGNNGEFTKEVDEEMFAIP